MIVADLLAECHAKDIVLQSNAGRLDIDAPGDALTPELLARLREHKAELIASLAALTDLAATLAGLTPDDLAHYHARLAARRDAGEPAPGIEWRALVDVRVDCGHWPAAPIPPRSFGRRLVGVEYPTRTSPTPDPGIVAAQVPQCPRCGVAPVLPELRMMADGMCWSCWKSARPAKCDAPRQRPDLRNARLAAAERFQRIAGLILTEAGVSVVEYHDRGLCGTAWAKERRVRIPRPTTRRRLYVAAHEAGHVAHGHATGRTHRQEYEAERYAHEALRRHGVAVPRKETEQARRYVARKIHQAIRRGAKTVDREALAWCKEYWTADTRQWVERQARKTTAQDAPGQPSRSPVDG